jgi:hypothetical protein
LLSEPPECFTWNVDLGKFALAKNDKHQTPPPYAVRKKAGIEQWFAATLFVHGEVKVKANG